MTTSSGPDAMALATAERCDRADLLDTRTDEEQAAPSLGAGWSVREVVPLGRPRTAPGERLRAALDMAPKAPGLPSPEKVRGLHLGATDLDWHAGW